MKHLLMLMTLPRKRERTGLKRATLAVFLAMPLAFSGLAQAQTQTMNVSYGFHSPTIQSACGGDGGNCLEVDTSTTRSGSYWHVSYSSNPPREGPIVGALITLYGANTTVTTLKQSGQTTQMQITPTIDAISSGSWVIKYTASECAHAGAGIGHQIGFPVSISHGALAYPGRPHCLAVFAVGTQSNGGEPFAWATFTPPG